MPWEYASASGEVRMRVHLHSTPDVVYRFLATDAGRESFWAEEAREADSRIRWLFASGERVETKVLAKEPSTRFECEYRDGTVVEFELEDDGRGGTDLTLTQREIPEGAIAASAIGWSSVLMNLKAVVDFAIDLRNHSADLSDDRGFVDN
jgi:uncharacterized protein YndB with AHSA1/START domain